MFRSTAAHDRFRVDPRTKIALTITVGCFCLARAGGALPAVDVVRLGLACLPVILLPLSRRWSATLVYVLLLAVSLAAAAWLLPALVAALSAEPAANGVMPQTAGAMPQTDGVMPHAFGSAIVWLAYATIAMTTQMLPVAMISYWMLVTTTASELVTALARMHMPQAVTIPLAVMFRFFPTAFAEQRRIGDAMRMRGVRLGGTRMFAMFEYRVVPLIGSSVRIADELAQAAMTRGLGGPAKRTSIARIGFHAIDAVLLTLCMACFVVWIGAATGWLSDRTL
ncbi:energy-coupling factor transporter transmembrane component T [Bifidobacterium simiarum]|uniref:energy-coupling factor transporter transmembrane component T n=1 Tax=Bifidobacterium simiarum TaxID=2045441 RepID=UPI001BDC9EDA|nr:energy-coupling factor transporter transmembrane component T [Bifidobacterium simiarum]MBT1166095.1 energy-coupling factor transporter transmembrane protein EcfT [Bifidobacterium simiarum]